jgi:glycerol-3-phosphate dehydrogenase
MQPRPALADLPARFDLVVIGGGITGAGILHEAAQTGASVLLVEQNDFASGTSCASSKLVHGGLRYLKEGQWRLTLESVRERNRLLRERGGLVQRQPFLMPVYQGMKPGRRAMRAGLAIYDLMGGQWASRSLSAQQALALEPALRCDGLLGAVAYDDAQTDDVRLVLRLIFEAEAAGATALNYVRVMEVLKTADGRVRGLALRDGLSVETREIEAALVINAAGVWSAELPGAPGGAPLLRPLRGSHLLFPLARLPLRQAVSWLHPHDRRPVFVYPWEGVALCGTTDLDHDQPPALPPRLTAEEARYLVEGLQYQFPCLGLSLEDALASYSGVRPVVAGGKTDPSAESRESASWSSAGWIGITGGKLTTFRVTARQVLMLAAQQLPQLATRREAAAQFSGNRIHARYGLGCVDWLAQSAWAIDRQLIPGTPYLWGELRWAARQESVVRLSDLLLRRTRVGLLVPRGGAALLDQVAAICREELHWDELRLAMERSRYLDTWRHQHAVLP